MLIQPDALLWHAKRCGLTILRSEHDTLLVWSKSGRVAAEWETVLGEHKAALLPFLERWTPPAPAAAPNDPVLSDRGQWDLFGYAGLRVQAVAMPAGAERRAARPQPGRRAPFRKSPPTITALIADLFESLTLDEGEIHYD